MRNGKKNKLLFRFTGFLMAISLSGCLHTYYTPNMHQAPLLSTKGEASFTAGFSSTEQVASIEAQGAYALTNHFAVIANASRGTGKFTETYYATSAINYEGTRRHLLEVGGGYFRPFHNNLGVFEVYGGGGLGSVYNYYDTDQLSYSTVKFNRFFIQPGVGTKGEYFDFIFSVRFASVNYYAIKPHQLGENAEFDAEALRFLDHNRNYTLAEPALTLRGGFKNIKFQLQSGLSFSLSTKEIPQDNINTSFGIYFNLFPKASK